MNRVFTSAILLIFIFTPILSTWSHKNHSDDWEIWDELRREKLFNRETRWRQDEQREIQRVKDEQNAIKALLGLLSPSMGMLFVITDSLDTLWKGPDCPKCLEEQSDIWDHRVRCPAGHYYWSCVNVERSNHKYCPPHPTDCLRCYGTGCLYCYHPHKGYRCTKCLEYGSHQCPFEGETTE